MYENRNRMYENRLKMYENRNRMYENRSKMYENLQNRQRRRPSVPIRHSVPKPPRRRLGHFESVISPKVFIIMIYSKV